ncbi:carbohydrate ABC transporter substrate-binding protein [Streptomyces sp. 110]|uniref:Carbohydrate ABC transporter substrate-binding protein n=1 Tax=Streptomyces endocoffeicus TaxID=2898945 RepID=A0ABS1Q1K6_9ACTN|nr:ABC transporter substrate-binding protein [Streptomyces endocoffeicus]MBL1118209.1 carbohydrate ABC transporter substrate-binding protein [Streptomyces endocoffeicus]
MMFRSRTRWRTRTAAALAALTALGLSACTSGGPSHQVAGDVEQTITWWSWNPNTASSKQWISVFEKEHPHITVQHRYIQYSNYVNAVRLAATTSSGPDVFGVQAGAITTNFAPLTVDLAPLASKSIGSDWRHKLAETGQLTAKGKQVALPWMITGAGTLWYSKGLLERVGIPGPPATLDGWLTACKKLEAIGKTCFMQGAKDDWVNIDMFQSIINQIAPGAFYDAVQGKGSATFDSPAFVRAFEIWKSLFSNGIMQPGALGQTQSPDANDAFFKGQAAFVLLGTFQDGNMSKKQLAILAGTYGDQMKSQVFLPAPFPDVVGDAKENGRLFGGPDVGWSISAKSAHRAAAFTFVKWLTASKTAQKMMGSTLAGQPALKSVPVDDSDVVNKAGKAALKEQAKQLANLIGPRQIPTADVQTALGLALSSVASGQSSPEAGAQSVHDAVDSAK